MAVRRYAYINIANLSITAHPTYFICDTTAELPSSGLKRGDTALTKDTNIQYKAVDSSTWTVVGSSSPVIPPVTPPPTGGTDFAPIVGALTGDAAVAAVRANTAPLAVTRPGTVNVECFPTDTTAQIRTKIAGATGVVWFNKGTYALRGAGDTNDAAIRLNTSNNGVTIVLESAAGYTRTSANSAVFDGGATQMSSFFWTGAVNCQNITIRGGCFQNIGYSTGNQYDWGACIKLEGFGHTIEDAIAQNNQIAGLANNGGVGSGLNTFRRCYAVDNGLSGLNAYSGTELAGTNPYLVEKCRANHNGLRQALSSSDPHYVFPNGSYGNTKFFINNATFDANWVHDGIGFGLWNDWRHYNTTVTNNVIENNTSAGAFWESTNGNNRFYHNYFKDNGNGSANPGFGFPYGAGNLLFTGPDSLRSPGGTNDATYGYPIIDVAYNDLDSSGSGPPASQWPNGAYPFLRPHPWAVLVATYSQNGADSGYWGRRAVKIHHNRIWFRGTGLGMGGYDDTSQQALWAEPTNEWHHNEYHVQSMSAANWYWAMPGQAKRPFTWTEWQAVGKDTGSTRIQI
jgi:hypothetical protein